MIHWPASSSATSGRAVVIATLQCGAADVTPVIVAVIVSAGRVT
jgi:hypothetical protein